MTSSCCKLRNQTVFSNHGLPIRELSCNGCESERRTRQDRQIHTRRKELYPIHRKRKPPELHDNIYLMHSNSSRIYQQMNCLHVMFLVCVLMLCSQVSISSAIGNNILRLNIPTDPPLDANTVCKTFPSLTSLQYQLCSRYPDVTASAIQGVQVAIHECQFQLRSYRWNCSALEKKNKNPHVSPLLARGYKESAFAYAISAAGVTHQVSKACSMGKLKSCGCDTSVHGRAKNWDWGGCSHNLEFGVKFAMKFLDSKESARDLHAKVNLHNNKIGRLTVMKNVHRKCKCHGMSGGCELQTCWKAAPDFRYVGDVLQKKFKGAKRLNMSNQAGHHRFRRRRRRSSGLLFYEKSPNFCDENPLIDSPGTAGRFCNKTSKGIDRCDTLCCGRGYDTMRVRRKERCFCKFHWCCYVICKTCIYDDWVTVCK